MTTTTERTAAAINRLLDSWADRYRPESMSTDWGQTLLAYGVATGTALTENEKGREFLDRWLSYHLSAGVHLTYFVGSWGIGLLYPEIVDAYPRYGHELRALAARLDEMIRAKSLRNGRGVILHNVDLPHIYVDTVYYTCPVLARLGATLCRDDWRDEAITQLEGHCRVLNIPGTPFYVHCEQNLSGLRSEGAWGRGNGWVIMTCGELLPFSPSGSPARASIEAILLPMLEALLPLQTTDGMWRTILDHPTAYPESSTTAMILFGMMRARRAGYGDERYDEAIARGIEAVIASIDADGRFLGASEGTWPGTIDYYLSLERGEWWWGTGAALLALAEHHRFVS